MDKATVVSITDLAIIFGRLILVTPPLSRACGCQLFGHLMRLFVMKRGEVPLTAP